MTIPTPEPRIERFEELAYGLFMHWGLYSLIGKGEWIMHLGPIPRAEYAPLTAKFTAEDFDAPAIARMAREGGMRYAILTTRHHDGFSLYDTRSLDDYDAPHSAAKRDLVAEFVEACRTEGIEPHLYHTTLDWRWDSANCDQKKFDEYLDYLYASVELLCRNYGRINGFFFDGNWSRRDADWKEDRLYGMMRQHQPDTIIVNNTGMGPEIGRSGHPEIDVLTYEQTEPSPPSREGMSKYLAAEMYQTINRHWGIGAHDFAYLSPRDVIRTLCRCRKVRAGYVLNVGPTGTGAIPEYDAATLRRTGQWVAMHADPIYRGRPVDCKCTGDDFVLECDGAYYLFVHDLAIAGHENVTVGGAGGPGLRTVGDFNTPIKSARWMDNDESLDFIQDADRGHLAVNCTGYPYGTNLVVRVAELQPA